MKLNPKPATRRGQTTRLTLLGLSGSGKTLTALKLATHLTDNPNRILLIDTENESAGLYAEQYPFQTHAWTDPHHPTALAGLLGAADRTGDYDVIVVDSATQFWSGKGGVLEIVEDEKRRNPKSFGWGKGTGAHNDFMAAILNTRCHLIVTVRAKNSSADEKDMALSRLGVKPDQRDSFMFEFNTAVYVHPDHRLEVVKARCPEIAQGDVFDAKDGAAVLGGVLSGWLEGNEGLVSAVEAEQITGLFGAVPEDRRVAAKKAFVGVWGRPDRLESVKFGEAFEAAVRLCEEFKADDPFATSEECLQQDVSLQEAMTGEVSGVPSGDGFPFEEQG